MGRIEQGIRGPQDPVFGDARSFRLDASHRLHNRRFVRASLDGNRTFSRQVSPAITEAAGAWRSPEDTLTPEGRFGNGQQAL